MGLRELINLVMTECQLNAAQDSVIEKSLLEEAVMILADRQWRFLYGEHTLESVVDQAEYTLTGESTDCCQVLYMEYDGNEIEYLEPVEFARRTSDDYASVTSPCYWTIKGYSTGKHPILTIWGTPLVAGRSIFYIYHKLFDTDDPFDVMPKELEAYVREKIVSRFHPNPQDRASASRRARELKSRAISRWTPKRGGVEKARVAPQMERMNRDYNQIHSSRAAGAGGFIDSES